MASLVRRRLTTSVLLFPEPKCLVALSGGGKEVLLELRHIERRTLPVFLSWVLSPWLEFAAAFPDLIRLCLRIMTSFSRCNGDVTQL